MTPIGNLTASPWSKTGSRGPSQPLWLYLLLAAVVAIAASLIRFGWRQSLLFLIGTLFGLTLYHASFGFASSYRRLVVQGDGQGVLAQVVMLALATVLFAPILMGELGRGSLAPVALQGAIGALVFGVGMQLGSGCACGTLYTIGGGSSMMLFTLLTFGLGSFLGTLTNGFWQGLPQTEPLALVALWGWGGVALQLALLGLLGIGLWHWQRRQGHETLALKPLLHWRSLLYGPWSLVTGAVVLALLNTLTLLLAGRPWGVTWGFTLWTAKLATLLGWNPASSEFWSQEAIAEVLQASVFADITSVMNVGIVLGAAIAAAIAGRLTVRQPPSRLAVLAALIGGLMMGYGAWLAFGCNVGAYFSGIASTSLHGWLWIAFALLGTLLGVKLRPLFQLSN
ncbi:MULTISPECIES: YeeE/YedE family protein [Cyanophyceae]|uniref:YeeE/YedE family protein n=1 Tax=Leptolyngbya subtilissima DQ-A4 TaxID=2933933 RepID=A0ABV0KAZ1_9CYAN|nr:YeeE/YedE family protein [Nodosilinea sp. FACHB-141]MBD2111865.1 YeeE/YedE family protein [Nodosilinea sp. FACHB-141]